MQHLGWIGPDDPTLRPAARDVTRPVPAALRSKPRRPPHPRLADHFPGRVWAMPMSHWAYELDYGSRDWMPALIEHIDLDPGLLQGRNNAAAIEFAPAEAHHFRHFTQRLLEMLLASDFMLAFLGQAPSSARSTTTSNSGGARPIAKADDVFWKTRCRIR